MEIFFILIGVFIGAIFGRIFFPKKETTPTTVVKPHVRKEELEPSHVAMFVRNDLKMGKGKIAAQCSHAMLKLYRKAQGSDKMRYWIGKPTH